MKFAKAEKVSKIYGRHRALHQVSLALEPGSVTALLGPNGAGKSTLLWIFSTLSQPTSGELFLGDLPPHRAKEARGSIGLLSHSSLSYGDLTALENVSFYARLYGEKAPEEAAAKLLCEFGLEKALHRQAKTFSRGMTQRLGLARALVGTPELVLLDEPFTGLDRASTQTVVERIKALRDQGAMVLMISHDMATSAILADRQAILRRGRLISLHEQSLSLEALRTHYDNSIAGVA